MDSNNRPGSFASGLRGRRVRTHRGESTPPDTVAEKKEIFSGFNPDDEQTAANPEPPGRVDYSDTRRRGVIRYEHAARRAMEPIGLGS